MIDGHNSPAYNQPTESMDASSVSSQLELFELPPVAPRRPSFSPLRSFQIRVDHGVLFAIVGLIGVSVMFACGVERGKQLARHERPLLAPQMTATADHQVPAPMPTTSSQASLDQAPAAAPAPRVPSQTPDQKPQQPKTKPAQRSPSKTVAAATGFAIQVVTYANPKPAEREMERLKGQGEPAFLITTKKKKVVLCVGPFPSRENATAKLASLKQKYQDCFLRTL